MADQPESCKGCPLYGVGRGFVLGAGDPVKAKYAYILEAPGRDELSFELRPTSRAFLPTKEECDRELAIRERDYPDLEAKFKRFGVPVVGATGLALAFWIWQKVGIRREEVYIDNTLRCLPPKGKSGAAYPTGDAKKGAEKHCRQYDRIGIFKPDTAIVSLHPAGIIREITPLPLAVKDAEKARDFTAQGRRTVTFLGGKAALAFLGYAGNVQRWRGHYVTLVSAWYDNVIARLTSLAEKKKRATKPRAAKKSKKEILSSEPRADQDETTSLEQDAWTNAGTKKKRMRKTKKVSESTSATSQTTSEEILDEKI